MLVFSLDNDCKAKQKVSNKKDAQTFVQQLAPVIFQVDHLLGRITHELIPMIPQYQSHCNNYTTTLCVDLPQIFEQSDVWSSSQTHTVIYYF